MVTIINPKNGCPLHLVNAVLTDGKGSAFPIRNGVARIANGDNYTKNFGLQWIRFDKTQLDRKEDGLTLSKDRFFSESGWKSNDLTEKDILEVGSGAGRFSRVVLEHTRANLYSIDYSDAVSANFNNNSLIAPNRFQLFQASIYEMPFPDNSFDKVFCFGVLQHTPDFQSAVSALIAKAKPGSEVVVDFYPVNGWWTRVHAKYIFRPWTKKMSHEKLYALIQSNINWLIAASKLLNKLGLSFLTRFLPLVDLRTIPTSGLNEAQFLEWVLLDTFDMFSPEHDQPQRLSDVATMFSRSGADVTFVGFVRYGCGYKAAVVRGFKRL